MIIIALATIVIITGAAWLARKALKIMVCPICAGVSGTWILILLGRNTGWLMGDWNTVLALLMGGSVVGIAYQLEKKMIRAIFIPIGFLAAYALIISWWLVFVLSGSFLGLLYWVFSRRRADKVHHAAQHGDKIEDLKKQMEKCC